VVPGALFNCEWLAPMDFFEWIIQIVRTLEKILQQGAQSDTFYTNDAMWLSRSHHSLDKIDG
jgi:hypothetical protein